MIQDFELGYVLGIITVVSPIVLLRIMTLKALVEKYVKRLEELGESLEKKAE